MLAVIALSVTASPCANAAVPRSSAPDNAKSGLIVDLLHC